MLPHRSADFVLHCSVCQADAVVACTRCDRPLCGAHAPDHDRRCTACELEWDRRAGLVPAPNKTPVDDVSPYVRWAVIPTLGLMVISAITLAIMTGEVAMALIVGLLIGSALSVPLFGVVSAALLSVKVKRSLEPIHVRLRLRAKRQAFLAERSPRRALPAPGFGEEE